MTGRVSHLPFQKQGRTQNQEYQQARRDDKF
jgi:hypothetical protein